HRDRGNRRLRAGHRGGSGSDRLGPEGACEARGEPPCAGLHDLVGALAGARLLVALAPGRLGAPLALLAPGCRTVFGFDDPRSLVDSLDVPSCDTGWRYRIPVTVDNETGKELEDYQIPIVVDTWSPITASDMRPDGADIRVVSGDGASSLGFALEK